MRFEFLELNEILEIHDDQISRYGGSPGIRSIELLQSSLAMPEAGFAGQYLHKDIYEMAAAYLFHIAGNHPFVDGNKRTATVALLVFLRLNSIVLTADEKELEALVRMVASGKAGKLEIANYLRSHGRKKK